METLPGQVQVRVWPGVAPPKSGHRRVEMTENNEPCLHVSLTHLLIKHPLLTGTCILWSIRGWLGWGLLPLGTEREGSREKSSSSSWGAPQSLLPPTCSLPCPASCPAEPQAPNGWPATGGVQWVVLHTISKEGATVPV